MRKTALLEVGEEGERAAKGNHPGEIQKNKSWLKKKTIGITNKAQGAS